MLDLDPGDPLYVDPSKLRPAKRLASAGASTKPDRLLDLPTAMERLGVKSRETVYSMSRRGKLALVKVGRSTRVRESDVDRIVQHGA